MRKRAQALQPADRRPALWPWLLMPFVALAIYLALESVRHATEGAEVGPQTAASSAGH